MASVNANYNAGDTVPFTGMEIVDGAIITPNAGATIVIVRDGTKIIDGAACTESSDIPGAVYYSLSSAIAGTHDFQITFASGNKTAPGRIVVGAGTAALEATSQAILEDTDTYLDAAISSRLADADYTAPDNASITSILEDTAELQSNQDNWLTATGFSTFDNTVDEVITNAESREASKAELSDLSGVALSSENTAIKAETALILADTNELQSNQDNWLTASVIEATLSQDDFNALMDSYYTPGSGNTPGSVPPPDNADIVRVYMFCRKKDGTNLDSIEATIELPYFQEIAGQGWNALKSEWIYSSTSGLAYVDVPDTAYVKLTIKELKFKNILGYAVDNGTGLIRADQLLAALPE